MRIGDLVFLVGALVVLIVLVRIFVCALRGRWNDVQRISLRMSAIMAVYMSIVVGVSISTPRQWIPMGQEQRFDDWCMSVLSATRNQDHYQLAVRVTSRALGRPQRAADADLLLAASDGREVAPSPALDRRSLRSVLQPGESFDTVCDYDVPADARIIGAHIVHGAWPSWFIIGDRGSLLHKMPLVRLE
jgi:hypothetical protein